MARTYERWFSTAGFAVVAFDFRHLGESGGTPRQLMSLRRYERIVADQIAFLQRHLVQGSR